MNIEYFREYCLSKPGVSEHFPFDEQTLVFKVGGKVFALTDITTFEGINLKCDPDRAIDLREQYQGINPGYHMNKVHWNTVSVHSDVNSKLILELVDHSYNLIFKSLPAKVRSEITK